MKEQDTTAQHQRHQRASAWPAVVFFLAALVAWVTCNYNDNQTTKHCIDAGGDPTVGGCIFNTKERCIMPKQNVDSKQ